MLTHVLAAGAEGQGLQPGTCAWVDRPVNGAEPRGRVAPPLLHLDVVSVGPSTVQRPLVRHDGDGKRPYGSVGRRGRRMVVTSVSTISPR